MRIGQSSQRAASRADNRRRARLYSVSGFDAENRAALRRLTWTGGRATSYADLEDRGLEFWANAEPGTKLQAIWDAIIEAWVISGKNGPPPRFQGSAVGVGRHER
jgi:hypothetical protein